jgi:hypothetical protein
VAHLILIDRTADHAPALPSARFARTHQDRSAAAVSAPES